MTALLRPWRSGRLWRALVHVTLDVPVGLLVTIPTGVGVALTLLLAITLPLALFPLLGVIWWIRLMGRMERSRASALLDTPLADPVARLPKGSPWKKLKAVVGDRARWRELGYCVLRLPVGVVLAGIVLLTWAGSIAGLALPAYVAALPQDTAQFGLFGASQGPAAWALALAGLAGVALVAPWLTLLAGRLDAALAAWLLGPPEHAELAERAQRAETGRTAAIDAAEAERRRIERDLHDGAQQRLVALAVDLGTARERLETDPEGAKTLVAEAHSEAKAALKEIRDLVRGFHPVILEDRGLDAALSAVVARSPVPVDLTVDLPARPPEPVESAAYFVVSEALANIARHADATQAHVAVVRNGPRLVVEIRDDGRGGADPARGTGLQGLRDHIVALGGTMDLLSPVGGPTTLLVELPCAS